MLIGSILSNKKQLGVITQNMYIDSHTLAESNLTRTPWPIAPQVGSLSQCYNVAEPNFERKVTPCVIEKLSCLVRLPARAVPVKWQGLNVSRCPTDGQQSPNPGEEAGWCNKVQKSNRVASCWPELCHETCWHVPPELQLQKGAYIVSVQVLCLLMSNSTTRLRIHFMRKVNI